MKNKRTPQIWSFIDMKTGHTLGLTANSQRSAADILKSRGYKFKNLKKHK